MLSKPDRSPGKLRTQDQLTSRLLTWMPAVMTALAVVPLPVLFLILFLTSATTDSAAFYLILSLTSLGGGLLVAFLTTLILVFYRRSWSRRLRDRLAADGITAAELSWFQSELTTEEKRTWRELRTINPLLADAYAETLATRLTAARIASRARAEMLRIERNMNRIRHLRGADTVSLIDDLTTDRQRADSVRKEAHTRELQAKARLQTIDAAARRELNQIETSVMLDRLNASQDQMPLGLQMLLLEQDARNQIANASDSESGTRRTPSKGASS